LLAIAIWLYYGDDIKKWKLFGTGKKKKKWFLNLKGVIPLHFKRLRF
jgi:hypothetical protein